MTAALPTDLQAHFDHAAHAAARIRDLLPLYAEQLGGRFLYGGDNPRVGYRGVVLGFAGGGKVELLEPLPGSSFFDSFFARHPAGGLHHLTFRVADVRRAIDRAREAGFEIVGVNDDEPAWREAFVHPRSGHGVLVQFVESNPDYPRLAPGQTLESTLAGEAA
jgi:methylmalonyl-CoA/ethylmalonyl-CoA epimerase